MEVLQEFNNFLDAWAHKTFPDIADEVDVMKSGMQASWLVPPHQQFWEILFIGGLGLITMIVAMGKPTKTYPAKPMTGLWKLVDWVLVLPMIVSLVAMLADKTYSQEWVYILQPCHLFSFAMVFMQFSDPHSPWVKHALNITLAMNIPGTLMAILFADLRTYTRWWAIMGFWWQHYALLYLPIWWILTQKYPLQKATMWTSLTGWGFFVAFHFFINTPASIIFSANVNYMLVPPINLVPYGRLYRLIMIPTLALQAFFFRFASHFIFWLFVRPDSKKKSN